MNAPVESCPEPPSTPRRRVSALAVTALLLALLFLPLVFGATSFQLLTAAVAVITVGHAARARIARSGGALRGQAFAIAALGLGYCLIAFILFDHHLVRSFPLDRRPGPIVDSANLRQIGQVSLIYANDHDDYLPGASVSGPDGRERPATIQDVAFLLAKSGGLDDGWVWVSMHEMPPGGWEQLGRVLDATRSGLHPGFSALEVLAVDYVTGLRLSDPSWTPVAWSRGLREDGSWDPEAVYGREGGYICFLNGITKFYRNVSDEDFLRRPDGTPTANILEALPAGARVVGAGPASLNGRVGLGTAAGEDRRGGGSP